MPKNIHNLKIGSNPTSQAVVPPLEAVPAPIVASGSFGSVEATLNTNNINKNIIGGPQGIILTGFFL